MQFGSTINNHESIESLAGVDMASFYRTKWLMAHNRLHEIAHEPSASLAEKWNAYLDELQAAEDMARQPI